MFDPSIASALSVAICWITAVFVVLEAMLVYHYALKKRDYKRAIAYCGIAIGINVVILLLVSWALSAL